MEPRAFPTKTKRGPPEKNAKSRLFLLFFFFGGGRKQDVVSSSKGTSCGSQSRLFFEVAETIFKTDLYNRQDDKNRQVPVIVVDSHSQGQAGSEL